MKVDISRSGSNALVIESQMNPTTICRRLTLGMYMHEVFDGPGPGRLVDACSVALIEALLLLRCLQVTRQGRVLVDQPRHRCCSRAIPRGMRLWFGQGGAQRIRPAAGLSDFAQDLDLAALRQRRLIIRL